jgi:DNA-binding FadR family transcriptional regulator
LAGRKEKAAARVAQEIVQTIYDDGLVAGDHYLSEADALRRHGVSRATLREALRFLEFQGVLHIRAGPGGGAIVQKPDWPRLTSTFALLLQFADAPLSSVLEARAALEPAMTALAVANATPERLAILAAAIADARKDIADVPSFFQAYRRFWAALAGCTGNPVTELLWPALRSLVDSGGFVPHERHRTALIVRMDALLGAMQASDTATAAQLVRDHDIGSARRLARLYPKRMARRVAWSDVSDP